MQRYPTKSNENSVDSAAILLTMIEWLFSITKNDFYHTIYIRLLSYYSLVKRKDVLFFDLN